MSDTDTALLDPETEQADTPSEDGQEQAGDEEVGESLQTEQEEIPSGLPETTLEFFDLSDIQDAEIRERVEKKMQDYRASVEEKFKGFQGTFTKKTQELAWARKVAEDVNRAAQEAGYPDYFTYKQAAIAAAQAKVQDEPETPEDEEYLTEEQKELRSLKAEIQEVKSEREDEANRKAVLQFQQVHKQELSKMDEETLLSWREAVMDLEILRDAQIERRHPKPLSRQDILEKAYKMVTYPQAKKAQQATNVRAKQPPKTEDGSRAKIGTPTKPLTREDIIRSSLNEAIDRREMA